MEKMIATMMAATALATGVAVSAENAQQMGAEVEAQIVQVFEDYGAAMDELLAQYQVKEDGE